MSTKIVKTEDEPVWESLQEMIDYFNRGITAAMLSLARIMWEAGRAGHLLQTESKYGDNAISEFAEGIHKGNSWVYECIKMYQAYTWKEINDKFLKAGIPASSIARLSAIKDEGARNYVEDKLVSGDITYEGITAAKSEYEKVINNPEVAHTDIGDGTELAMDERQAVQALPDDDPNNIAAASIRSFAGSETRGLQERRKSLEDKAYGKIDQLDMITDPSLYDISANRLAELAMAARDLMVVLGNIAESIELKTGASSTEK